MPIFLDQSLRKAIISKIRESFGKDEVISGAVKVLDQESFLPEAPNQIVLTDLQVANESLDASNRVTDLYGTVTFAPLKKAESTFLFWAQENPYQTQLIQQGFYHLRLKRSEDNSHPDAGWSLSVEVIPRITKVYNPCLGLKISLPESLFPSALNIDLSKLQVTQFLDTLTYGDDYVISDTSLYLRRYERDTKISYDSIDITDQCSYWDLATRVVKLKNVNPPIQFNSGAVLSTVSVYNLTHNYPMKAGFTITQKGLLTWKHPVKVGVELFLNWYEKKPLKDWPLPTEFCFTLEAPPLSYNSGVSSLVITSNLRGVLPPSMYSLHGSDLKILEPIPNESISLEYRYHLTTLPPVEVTPATINDQSIPGICLTFTDNFIDGDEVVVIKHDQQKAIGEENGGTNKVELSLRIRSADDRMLERMTSRVFFLFTDQTSLLELSNQGISLENSVSYVRSYEDRDGNSEKWLVNTFRLTMHHTWRYLIPFVTDLNSMSVSVGVISTPTETGAPTFRDLICSSTENSWIQPY